MQKEIKIINMGGVNCYLAKTVTGFILIDSGLAANRATLEKELEMSGVNSENLKLIILTHGDIDHSGNCAYLREKYGVKIAMHTGDFEMVESGNLHADRKVNSFLLRFIQALNKPKFTQMMASFERFKPDLPLEEGQNLKEYGWDAVVLHIPGHTGGSIGLLTASGDLFVGDTLNNMIRPTTAVIISDETELAASITRLKALNVKTVYPGHGKPFLMSSFS